MLARKEKMTQFVTRMKQAVGKVFGFWLVSFGQMPGLSRDAGLPQGDEAGERHEPLVITVPALSPEARLLAEEMAWGVCWRVDAKPARNRMRM